MKKRLLSFLLFVIGAMAIIPNGAWAATVQSVQVELHGSNTQLPPALAKRMSNGIETAGSRVLVGKDSNVIHTQQSAYEQALMDIISRILYGYEVETLTVVPDEVTTLEVTVKPYGKVVEAVDVSVEYGNLTPLGKSLLAPVTERLELQLNQVLLGAPVDSLDWVSGVAEAVIRNRLADTLPEFSVKVDTTPGSTTKARVYLVPQGAIVRRVETEIESKSLPTMMFWSTKKYFDGYLAGLEGLPVAFVARQSPILQTQLEEKLSESRAVSTFKVKMMPSLAVGSTTTLQINVESDKYVIQGEGRLDMGRKENNVSFLAHIGYNITPSQEIYLETEFYPNNYTWKFYPSYAYRLTDVTRIGYQYNVTDSDHRIWLRQDITPRWHIRAQRDLRSGLNEFGLAYDLHSYITLEYIINNDENWLRVVGRI